jgi:hypothetical protein
MSTELKIAILGSQQLIAYHFNTDLTEFASIKQTCI